MNLYFPLNPDDEDNLNQELKKSIIYRCVTGSKAYGLDNQESDTDIRGIYILPSGLQWSIYKKPEQLEFKESEEIYWELQKFLYLALKANPNVLECLFTPIVLMTTSLAEELLQIKEAFISKQIYQTYGKYIESQFRKLEQDKRNHSDFRWKHAMHLIRILLSGILALQNGSIIVDVANHKERLLAIKYGNTSWDEINNWRLQLQQEFEYAYTSTSLPDNPDFGVANDFLVRARKMRAEDKL